MSFSTFLVVCMAVAAFGGVLIIVALVIGRRRGSVAESSTASSSSQLPAPIPAPVEPIEDLTPEVVLDLDPDIQSPRPISHVPTATMPAGFGPRPFDDMDTRPEPRVARGTTNPPPIPEDARARRRPTSVPPPIPTAARRHPTERSN